MAKHAQSKSRDGSWGLAVLAVLAVVATAAVCAAVVVDDPAWAPQAAVAGAAVIALIAILVIVRLSRHVSKLRSQQRISADQQRREVAALRDELMRLSDLSRSALAELASLRQEMSTFLQPVLPEPDPVYPSLRVPLVQGAFAQFSEPATVLMYQPPTDGSEVPPTVRADAGSEGLPPRHLVDLTTEEYASRHVAGL